ncbi:MAG: Na+/H+ antiporter NhaA [Clostridiales bacterium]|nr:Na+/H+ antiporter NhaA [Clostridiales bacterium]
MSAAKKSNILTKITEYSLPLLAGVALALLWANLWSESYDAFIHAELLPGKDFHFLVNDIFMVFFFGIAGAEIVRSVLPGGSLNRVKTAVTPLVATVGGIFGPIAVFFLLNGLIGSPDFSRGWAVPTATDIALSWLVARLIFGAGHPAVAFLLLLAVADDAAGLFIIAVFYPDPLFPVEPLWLLLVLAGMGVAFALQKAKVRSFWPYIMGGGVLAWFGMYNAHLHPALALVFIVPFLPFRPAGKRTPLLTKPLDGFEHTFKPVVDFGLILFGISNAGVAFSSLSNLTWIVLAALLVGKTGGIFLLGNLARLFGFPLPAGMRGKELFVTGLVAAIGLTVALFMAEVAYAEPSLRGAAKMGALFSFGAALIALAAGRLLKIKRHQENRNHDGDLSHESPALQEENASQTKACS